MARRTITSVAFTVGVDMEKKTTRKGRRLIFRAWRTLPNGTRLYARDYGLKAWAIWV